MNYTHIVKVRNTRCILVHLFTTSRVRVWYWPLPWWWGWRSCLPRRSPGACEGQGPRVANSPAWTCPSRCRQRWRTVTRSWVCWACPRPQRWCLGISWYLCQGKPDKIVLKNSLSVFIIWSYRWANLCCGTNSHHWRDVLIRHLITMSKVTL